MRSLVLKAYVRLIVFDLYLARDNFKALCDAVRQCRVRETHLPADAVERICAAVDIACVWYWKEVLCLQRSAATTCVLKRCGVDAQMIIGAQQIPFKAHAWVEVDGQVVNDKTYIPEMYIVLDRC